MRKPEKANPSTRSRTCCACPSPRPSLTALRVVSDSRADFAGALRFVESFIVEQVAADRALPFGMRGKRRLPVGLCLTEPIGGIVNNLFDECIVSPERGQCFFDLGQGPDV